ncbi:MAG: AtpZ/AtpI family protein [Lachnospiraceae bacterium]|nr:AtpZ/AtpI family protein [Lachnospiraceae bacterium]
MRFNKDVYRTLTLITQFGINMLVPIFICSFAGIYLDKKLGTDFIMIILFFIGAISGGYNIYRLSKRYFKKDERKDKQDRI